MPNYVMSVRFLPCATSKTGIGDKRAVLFSELSAQVALAADSLQQKSYHCSSYTTIVSISLSSLTPLGVSTYWESFASTMMLRAKSESATVLGGSFYCYWS